MAFSQDFLLFVLDQFVEFGEVTYKKMFGGVGFYKDGVMFGGIMGGELHLKVNDETRPLFIERGMDSFFHTSKSKGLAKYYKVPADIVEDPTELAIWAQRALDAALSK